MVTNSNVPECSKPDGCPSGTFDPTKSSTYKEISAGTFDNPYGDGTEYRGDFGSDNVTVGNLAIPQEDILFGLANNLTDGPILHNTGSGLVGIGFQSNSGASSLFQDGKAPTIVSAMVKAGIIARQAYSLVIGSAAAGSGSVIFGGVEPSLYTGPLVALPLLPGKNGNITEFLVALTGVSINDLNGTRSLTDDSFVAPVLMDSGTTVQNLPAAVVDAINGGFGVTTQSDQSQRGLIPCTRAKANVSLTYHFGGQDGPTITIPLSSMTKSQEASNTTFDDGENACYFGVVKPLPGSDTIIFGDVFMQSGYFVFDLENNQLALAQAATSPSAGSVTAIPTGTEIPGCSSTNTYSYTGSAVTDSAATDGGPAASSTDSGGSTSVLPVSPTFDLGSVTTETANETPTGTGGGAGGSAGGSSSSSGAAARPTGMGRKLEQVVAVVAVVGGIAAL